MIDKITIKGIELTLDEAKELKGELDSLFGGTQFIPYYPYYPPYNPQPEPFIYQPFITWGDSGTAGTTVTHN